MLLFDGKNCNLTLQGGKDTRRGEGLRSSLASCLRQHTWNLLEESSSNTSISLAATTRWPWKQVHFWLWGREYGQAGSKCEACPACRRRSAIFIFRQLHSTKTNLSLPLVLISVIKHQEAFTPHFRGHPGGNLLFPHRKPEYANILSRNAADSVWSQWKRMREAGAEEIKATTSPDGKAKPGR